MNEEIIGVEVKGEVYPIKEDIDNSTISNDKTWSSEKINNSLIDINTTLKELIKTKKLYIPYSNLGNGSSMSFNPYNYGIEMEGYTPIGIIEFRAENVAIVPVHLSVSNNKYSIIIRNISGATASDRCEITILYIKNF